MLNCDYTYKTIHQFYDSYCEQDENVNMVGLYCQNEIENLLNYFPTNLWTQFFISDVVDIPCTKPDIDSIMSIYSHIEIIRQRVIKTPVATKNGWPNFVATNSEGSKLTGKKLVIEGILKQKIVYTGLVADKSLYSHNFELPFATFIVIPPDIQLSQKFKIGCIIEDVFISKLSEKSIFKNTTIFIRARPI